MLRKLLRMPRGKDVEVGVAVPIGCLVPLAIAAAALVGAGVLIGTRLHAGRAGPTEAVDRVIDSGAPGGPKLLSTQVMPLALTGRRLAHLEA